MIGATAEGEGARNIRIPLGEVSRLAPPAVSGYNRGMAEKQEHQAFAGFGLGLVPGNKAPEGVFILAVYRDGGLTASAHATERGAMEAAVVSLEDELDEGGERGTLEDLFARAQGFVMEEGGLMEIIAGPIQGA